jgi:hypothetical protein
MPEYIAITIRIPQETWEAIQRSTSELQARARAQGTEDAVFDAYVQAALLLEQAVDMEEGLRKPH